MARARISRFPKYSSVIGSNIRILGDIRFSGGLYVDGIIQGNVTAEGKGPAVLTLDENSRVEGDVRVPQLRLNGEVVGDVYASDHAELLPEARVSGTLYYRSLEMALGAEVNGQLVHTEEFGPEGGGQPATTTGDATAPDS
jgi:cytoskeletal protein CcmA (bactofilin family)